MFGCGGEEKGDVKDDFMVLSRSDSRIVILLIETGKKGEGILSEGMMNLILDTGSRSKTKKKKRKCHSIRYMRRKTCK